MFQDSYSIKQHIFEIISRRGYNNPILSQNIELRLNISGPVVRKAVRELRRSGEPIVATENGYFMAKNAREVDLIVRDLQNRISSMGKTISAIRRKAYERFGYQGQFGFGSYGDKIRKNAPGTTSAIHSCCKKEITDRDLFSMPHDNKQRTSRNSRGEGIVSGVSKDFALDDLL